MSDSAARTDRAAAVGARRRAPFVTLTIVGGLLLIASVTLGQHLSAGGRFVPRLRLKRIDADNRVKPMAYSYTSRSRRSSRGRGGRATPIAVIRGASARRPAPRPGPARQLSTDERFAPMVIGEDGDVVVHPDYE